jgi:hypothetical protein
MICRKLELKDGENLLDIGCGWGGLARHVEILSDELRRLFPLSPGPALAIDVEQTLAHRDLSLGAPGLSFNPHFSKQIECLRCLIYDNVIMITKLKEQSQCAPLSTYRTSRSKH